MTALLSLRVPVIRCDSGMPSRAELKHTFPGQLWLTNCLAFSPDGSTLATGDNFDDQGTTVGCQSRHIQTNAYRAYELGRLALLSARMGGRLPVGVATIRFRLWDTITGENRGIFTGHTGSVTYRCFQPGRKDPCQWE